MSSLPVRLQLLSRWRLFSTQAREHEEVLEKQATRVQAIFRGYRVRTLLADKDTHGPESDRAATIITRFLRQVGAGMGSGLSSGLGSG